MKSLIKKIFNMNSIISLRNNLNIKPIEMSLNKIKKNASVSDSFCWRTDNNYETIFRFTDLLDLFYKIDGSNIKIIFYNKVGNIIKELEIKNIKKNNQLIINKKFFDNLEDYGTFHIYHLSNKLVNEEIIISNRCYTGFSKQNNLHLPLETFIKSWSPCLFHFNLDPIDYYPGKQAVHTASVGTINIGGVNDNHFSLYPETATCDTKILEERLTEYIEDENKRNEVITHAWDKANEVFSFSSVRKQIQNIKF